jgi:hypothetical protein
MLTVQVRPLRGGGCQLVWKDGNQPVRPLVRGFLGRDAMLESEKRREGNGLVPSQRECIERELIRRSWIVD